MSGGSFNYLCHKDASDMLNSQEDLEHMIDFLGNEEAPLLLEKTRQILEGIKEYEERVGKAIDEVRWLWRDVEWWQSCDSDRETFYKHYEEWARQHSNIGEESETC